MVVSIKKKVWTPRPLRLVNDRPKRPQKTVAFPIYHNFWWNAVSTLACFPRPHFLAELKGV
jgi:hypothetical protein